ncbi:hypothetical protein LLG96_18705 [bacterium]|nr:hypothetical protein [bacterium]
MKFSYMISKDSATGWNIVRLTAEKPGIPQKSMSIAVTPECGSNMFSFTAGGRELIASPDSLSELIARRTGCPILFPTPNRVREATYRFMDEIYTMGFPGEKISHLIHGLVWDDAWKFDKPEIGKDGISLKTWYVFDENNPRFPGYPFKCTLTVTFTLMEDRVRIAYEVQNQDNRPLGFGFGLHPFWKVIGDKKSDLVQVGLPYHMEAIDLLPTGKLEPVGGTQWDLNNPKPVSELSLDDVYFGATPESIVRVMYESIGLEIGQKATADFTHVVVYTPDRDYFCIENQTSSTDAHNLFDRGLLKESNLQIVQPDSQTGGHVDYIITWK